MRSLSMTCVVERSAGKYGAARSKIERILKPINISYKKEELFYIINITRDIFFFF